VTAVRFWRLNWARPSTTGPAAEATLTSAGMFAMKIESVDVTHVSHGNSASDSFRLLPHGKRR
jgi:hypothetical protein